jgi:hypothetical protein
MTKYARKMTKYGVWRVRKMTKYESKGYNLRMWRTKWRLWMDGHVEQ